MSSHLNRKDLKKDVLVAEVEQGVEYVASHKSQVTRYALIALAILVIGGGYWIYSSRQATAREEALREARRVLNAQVGTTATPPNKSYPTKEDHQKAITAAFTELGDKYAGSTEGSIGRMYLAAQALDRGDSEKAAALYKQVADNAPKEFESSAKLALAQVLWGQGKVDEGKKLLEGLISNPTLFVSADQASLTLGRLQIQTNPAEAKKTLEKLRESSTTVSSMAVELLGQIPPVAN
ncbi:MAG: tetratricopeptide repeat protein [Bryobacteraceae bacterium]